MFCFSIRIVDVKLSWNNPKNILLKSSLKVLSTIKFLRRGTFRSWLNSLKKGEIIKECQHNSTVLIEGSK